MGKKASRWLTFLWYFVPPTFWLLFFFFIPLATLLVYSFGVTNELTDIDIIWTLENYWKALSPIYLRVFLDSFVFALATTAICLVVGFFVALFISFAPSRYKNLWLFLIILPFWTNLLIRVYGVQSILREQGAINNVLYLLYPHLKSLLAFLQIDFLPAEFVPLPMLYNNFATILGLVYVGLPFMVLPIYGSMDKMNKEYIEASLDLGASHIRTLWQVVVPMVRPGIISGCLLTFIPTLGVFVIPDLLGSPDTLMIGNVIQRQFGEGQNWPFGSALAFLLIYITFFGFALSFLGGKRRNDVQLSP